jgi:hypothetical protein
MKIEKYTFGHGDRFMHQGRAQLAAVLQARNNGADVCPVWNKSHREHTTIGTEPGTLRQEVDETIRTLGYDGPYHLDADHINRDTVDHYLDTHDFFTMDMTRYIGQIADAESMDSFVQSLSRFEGNLKLDGLEQPINISRSVIEKTAASFLQAIQEAGNLYRYIADKKGAGQFITEISIDETDQPQSPGELFVILAAIAQEKIPVQTIAPKFSGRFNKGVDYIGDLEQFRAEFQADLAIIRFVVREFRLPENLKLSVHSGSDKFSLYPVIRELIREFDSGLHLKTAGTTWLEECIGLAEGNKNGLRIVREIYRTAHGRRESLCAPYAEVIDINPASLPSPTEVENWDSAQFVSALRHDPKCPDYNQHFRQLLHVGYKVAAEMGDRFLAALRNNEESISRNVTLNLYERHLKPLFI